MKCILCNLKKYAVVRNNLRYGIKRRVLRCKNCGFIFLEPKGESTDFYKEENYRNLYKPDLKKNVNCQEFFDIYFPFQKELIKEIKHILRPNMKVLDIGCSTGHFLAALKGKVKERVGLELNREHADFIKKKLDFKVYSESIEKAEISEGPFDLITSLETLEHVDNPEEFLKGIIRNLKPNGYVFLRVPNIDDILLTQYQTPGYVDFYYREPHLWYFSKKTLKLLLDKSGLKGEIKTVQFYSFLNHLHWIFTDKPQDNFTEAIGAAVLVKADDANKGVKKDLNDFIKMVDAEYKKILAKRGVGDSLFFLGKKS